jgi:transcriptional regulator with XRE-family HTH domain
MPAADDPAHREARHARRQYETLLDEYRGARQHAGLSQHVIGTRLGMSRSAYSRIETGLEPRVPMELLGRIGGVLGLRLSLRAYPGGDPLRDIAQVRCLRRVRDRMSGGWRWRAEVPLVVTGDLRAWDMVGRHANGLRVWVEAESRIDDAQALLRRLALKRRDGAATRLILAVNDTRHNRDALRAAGPLFLDAFPVPARRALRMLANGEDPGGDILLVL